MKMFEYKISSGNPEGTDWTLDIQHEIEYSQEDFDKIVEAAFIESYQRQHDKGEKVYPRSMPDYETIFEILKENGFVSETTITATYYFEPYFSGECIGKDLQKAIEYWDNFKSLPSSVKRQMEGKE